MIRVALAVLILLSLTACHISINSKYGAFARGEAAAKKAGMDYGGGSGVSVIHFGGLTYSKSVTYIVGSGGAPQSQPVLGASFALASPDSLRFKFFYYSANCAPKPATYLEFKQVAKTVLQSVRSGMPTGAVNVYLVPEPLGIAKERFALKFGMGVDLAFYYPCDTTKVDRSAFAGFLDVMHELTHIIVGLQRLPVAGEQGEDLARGGPACVYEGIAGKDPAHLAVLLGPDTYFRSDPLYHGGNTRPDTKMMCMIWRSKLGKKPPN